MLLKDGADCREARYREGAMASNCRVSLYLKEEAEGKIIALPINDALKSVTIGESLKASLATMNPTEAEAVIG